MPTAIRVLVLEDRLADAELMIHELRRAGFAPHWQRVDNEEDYLACLHRDLDVILADYMLPQFDASRALQLLQDHNLDIPFIIVTGTISEETAIEYMKRGASDYLLKDYLTRLGPAIVQALQAKKLREEKRQAEQALRESEARFRRLAENAPDVIYRYRLLPTKGFDYISPAVTTLTGYTPEAHYRNPELFFTLIHPGDRALFEHLISTGENLRQPLVLRWIRNDGTVLWMEHCHVPVYDEKETIIALEGVARNITERRQAEEQIREQAALLDIVPDAIIVQDLKGRILFWNKGAEHLYGWTATEVVGKPTPFGEVMPSLDSAAQQHFMERGDWHGELSQVTKTNQALIVESRWTLMRNQIGQPHSILIVNTDITEKKTLEAQFLRAQRMESIGTLASGIAHDLNNILAPLLLAVQILQQKVLDEQGHRLLARLESSAQRGAEMVQHLLSFARGVEGERVSLDPRHLLREAKQITKETFPKSIQIFTKIPSELWMISGDATQLHQVLLNLCVNARDAMINGGTLTLAAENVWIDESYARMHLEAQVGPYVVFTVSDTGIGIPAAIIDKIFDPFFTTKEVGKGNGLGLSTALAIVKSHGGFINVYSEEQKGTTFRVYLPAQEARKEKPTRSERLPLFVGQGELVLVVDDEASIREITKETLETCGYRVLTASDGTEAIALYVQHQREIAVVVTDMMMPFMDGSATIRALQKLNPQVKIIATSGLSSYEKIRETAGANVWAFLPKPYTAKKLLSTLHDILQSQDAE